MDFTFVRHWHMYMISLSMEDKIPYMDTTISSFVEIHPHLTKLCYYIHVGELKHTHKLSYGAITVIPPIVARLYFIFWAPYMHLNGLRHFMDKFNILHVTINDTFLNITFQGQIFTFWFFQGQNNHFPSSKRLLLLVCYIVHTSIQYCIKTISVCNLFEV